MQQARLAWDAAHGKPQQPRETRVNIIAFLKQQGLDVEVRCVRLRALHCLELTRPCLLSGLAQRLPERSKHIVYGLKADFTYAEYIKVRIPLRFNGTCLHTRPAFTTIQQRGS